MRQTIAPVLLVALWTSGVSAQNTYESTEGTTSIEVFDVPVGLVTFNASDKSIALDYGNASFSEDHHRWYLLEASGKSKNDAASIVRTGTIAPEARVGVRFGTRIATNAQPVDPAVIARLQGEPGGNAQIEAYMRGLQITGAWGLWVVGGASLRGAKVDLYDPDAAFGDQVNSESFVGPEAEVSLNYWRANAAGVRVLAGASAGIARRNNIDDLTELDVEDGQTVQDGDGYRTVVERSTVFGGEYRTFTAFPLEGDLVLAPIAVPDLALHLYGRPTFRSGEEALVDVGAGVYILRGNNPRDPLGGIALEIGDLLDAREKDNEWWERLRLNLVVSIALPRVR